MTSQVLARDALMPRRPEATGRGVGLSLLVHAGLIIAIAFGVSWRSRTPEAQQAELWAAVPQVAAPRAVEPEPAIEPKPLPPPVAKPVPRVETPPPAPIPDAQIAIEKARVEKARKEQAAAEREAQRRKAEAERLAAEKLRQQQLERQKEIAKQKDLEAQKKQQAAEERQAQQREADRRKNIERMLGQAGASGERGATGTAQQGAGPSANYAGRIVARVRPNIVFADEVAGNPTAEVEVRAAADGTILGRKLVRSSGVTAYDNAVLRAIDKTEVLPRDVDGRVPPSLLLVFRVRD
jgi:colicin import membrane protein